MSTPFRRVSLGALRVLADSIEGGRLAAPFTTTAVHRLLSTPGTETISAELQCLADTGMAAAHLAYLLRAIADERAAGQQAANKVELVWTGPETVGSASRETSVVVRELFAKAREEVLIAGFAVTHGKHVFRKLAERMEHLPGLRVRMFLNVARVSGSDEPASQILRTFAESFLRDHWPGARRPEAFYDPRAFQLGNAPTFSLHAKCVVLDDQETFVTSANFTAAGQERNIEVGALIRDAGFATALRAQFDSLVEAGILLRIPGI